MDRYSKAVAAVLAAVLSALAPYLIGGHKVSDSEWVNVVILGLGAAAVYLAPNLPGSWSNYTKSIIAALVAGATLLASLIGAGSFATITPSEWVQVTLAALSALGVYAVPNVPPAAPVPVPAPPANP